MEAETLCSPAQGKNIASYSARHRQLSLHTRVVISQKCKGWIFLVLSYAAQERHNLLGSYKTFDNLQKHKLLVTSHMTLESCKYFLQVISCTKSVTSTIQSVYVTRFPCIGCWCTNSLNCSLVMGAFACGMCGTNIAASDRKLDCVGGDWLVGDGVGEAGNEVVTSVALST